MPAVELTKDFQCVTGWRVPDVQWKGVRLADVIDRAAPQAATAALEFESFDGAYTETLTLEQARRDDVIVAYELDGKPISAAHGGPVRLYVAPMYGYKSLKWLQRITLVAPPPRPGLLGAAGLRRRRLDRPVQRPERRAGVMDRFDRTERWLHWATATLVGVLVAHRRRPLLGRAVGHRRPADLHQGRPRHRRPVPPGPVPAGPARAAGPRGCAAISVSSTASAPTTSAGCAAGRPTRPSAWASSTPARNSTPPSSAPLWSRCWPPAWCCASSAPSRWPGGRAPPSSTTGRPSPSALAITGHVWLAMADPDALRGMVSGHVPAWWARQNRPRWYQEQERSSAEEPAGSCSARPMTWACWSAPPMSSKPNPNRRLQGVSTAAAVPVRCGTRPDGLGLRPGPGSGPPSDRPPPGRRRRSSRRWRSTPAALRPGAMPLSEKLQLRPSNGTRTPSTGAI